MVYESVESRLGYYLHIVLAIDVCNVKISEDADDCVHSGVLLLVPSINIYSLNREMLQKIIIIFSNLLSESHRLRCNLFPSGLRSSREDYLLL